MGVGGVIHQVEQGCAAGDEAEGLIIRSGEKGQQVAQVVALQESVLITLLMLQDFEDEEITSRAEHRADDLRA